MIRVLLLTLAFSCPGVASPAAPVDPYKPIVLINSFPPNGPADIVGRTITGRMLKLMTTFAAPAVTDALAARSGHAMGLVLDRIVRVERRAQGRGIPGIRFVVESSGDGDTLLFANNLELMIQQRVYRLPYQSSRDLKPVAAVARMPIAMISSSSGGPASVRDFMASARSSPAKLNYGSSGDLRSGHLAGELFAARAGLSLVHVPYNGGNEAVSGVVKGQVPVAFVPLPSVLPAIAGGKIRILGIADSARLESLPQVPTIGESGLAGFEAATWFGIYAPKGTAIEALAHRNHAVVTGLRATRTQSFLLAQGLQGDYSGVAEYGELLSAQEKKWMPILDRMNLPY